MKAAYITQTGPPEIIQIGDLPEPAPAGRQCLIQVSAVAVNPIDTYIRGGLIPMPLPTPFIVGCDVAGTVLEAGPEVTLFKKGDRVWGSNQGLLGRQGTFAERIAVDEDWLYPLPEAIKETDAAAIALVGITAHLGLVRHARLQPGETLFVNGGTGGVGSTVVQMAKALGARVITTAGTPEKVKACRALGADFAVNYATDDVNAAILKAAPDGVQVWWETLREPNFERTIPLLAMGGRIIVMAGRDARPLFPVGPFYVRDCSLHGFAMFNASPEAQRKCSLDINRWLKDGALKPRIDRVLPLDEAVQAHQLQEQNTIGRAGTLAGKIVLTP